MKEYFNMLLSGSPEHKALFTPHAKIFLKRLYSSLKNYNFSRPLKDYSWENILFYLTRILLVNGYKQVPDEVYEFVYSLYLSNPEKTDLVERFKDVYQQLKNNFWNVKPFVIDTESDTKAADEFFLDGKDGLPSKFPKRIDVQNQSTIYNERAVDMDGYNGNNTDAKKLYSYKKNSGLEYVRLQLGIAELAKIKGEVILERVEYENKSNNWLQFGKAKTEEEEDEVYKQAFLNPSLLPHIQVGYINVNTNKEVYFDGIIKERMVGSNNIPQGSIPLYLNEVVAKYLNEKWNKYQSLMPPYVEFSSILRKFSSKRYERLRLALATLELDFDQSEYTLEDLLGSNVDPNANKEGLYDRIFQEHVGEYLEQEHWGTYSIPKDNYKLINKVNNTYFPIGYINYNFDITVLSDSMDKMVRFFEEKFEYKFKKSNLKTHPEWFKIMDSSNNELDSNLVPFDYSGSIDIRYDSGGQEAYEQQLIEEYLTPTFADNDQQLNLIKEKIKAYFDAKKQDFKDKTNMLYNLDPWVKVQLIDLYTNPNNKELIYSHLGENDDFSQNIIAKILDFSFNKHIEYFNPIFKESFLDAIYPEFSKEQKFVIWTTLDEKQIAKEFDSFLTAHTNSIIDKFQLNDLKLVDVKFTEIPKDTNWEGEGEFRVGEQESIKTKYQFSKVPRRTRRETSGEGKIEYPATRNRELAFTFKSGNWLIKVARQFDIESNISTSYINKIKSKLNSHTREQYSNLTEREYNGFAYNYWLFFDNLDNITVLEAQEKVQNIINNIMHEN
ncbi:hypothetical protein [Mycoplasma sp. HS2188]|uniref:hypothetical protein n=1 Tax=Mycoplasma sp. HS2188 TaxID=2976765 RepID=UPI0021AA53CA|nr:hypothetical protein [Mycoplasma sp. HS2188]MCT4469799.1 hypothetical protein [Mycoplasma sp. HS2188]